MNNIGNGMPGGMVPPPGQLFPRPPAPPSVQPCHKRIQIKWCQQLIADAAPGEAFIVVEEGRAPTYYLPPGCIRMPLSTTPRTTFCQWRGTATYYSIMSPISVETVPNRIWSYKDPAKDFEQLKDYIAFCCGPWECYVDGERAHPPAGDFYGGWVTSDVEGASASPQGQWGGMAGNEGQGPNQGHQAQGQGQWGPWDPNHPPM